MTIDQIAKLNQIEQWLGEIIASAEFKVIVDDYIPSVDVTLGDAKMAVSQLLNYLHVDVPLGDAKMAVSQCMECAAKAFKGE
ncbi:hypothetical protein ACF3DV_34445 (plasmid) [Chlorogloeopsis fritschii PCC 9212]|uniref:Uncharacterized protein n=1 Tax=Chlorogloeopsis fritschii PCC 6912 TaxID=211165 RepID=A0A3S0XM72_CHLFR|nr:hypothetical protein [Chlorogloeopsis fritschii]RUR72618.1 hypothetical protein PCC6912_61750 [Chlorogloeopsis fritschii PCC 6912]